MHHAPTGLHQDQTTTNKDGIGGAREETSRPFGDATVIENKLEDQKLHLTVVAGHISTDSVSLISTNWPNGQSDTLTTS